MRICSFVFGLFAVSLLNGCSVITLDAYHHPKSLQVFLSTEHVPVSPGQMIRAKFIVKNMSHFRIKMPRQSGCSYLIQDSNYDIEVGTTGDSYYYPDLIFLAPGQEYSFSLPIQVANAAESKITMRASVMLFSLNGCCWSRKGITSNVLTLEVAK